MMHGHTNIKFIEKNTETLVVDCVESGLEVIAVKTKYMFLSRDQNAGRSHNVQIDISCFERVEQFKYLGTTLTDQKFY